MEPTSRSGHNFNNFQVAGSARVHAGDSYNYGPSPDERALQTILESLRYPGMTDRRDALAEGHEGTFDWTFLEGETDFLKYRLERKGEHDSDERWHGLYGKVDMNFKSWLQNTNQGLFCIMGKPGSGKSTFV